MLQLGFYFRAFVSALFPVRQAPSLKSVLKWHSVRPSLTTGFKMVLPSSSHSLSLSLVYFSPKYLLPYCIIYFFILFIVLFYSLGCVLHDNSTFCLLFSPIYPQGQELILAHYSEALNQNIFILSAFILEPH